MIFARSLAAMAGVLVLAATGGDRPPDILPRTAPVPGGVAVLALEGPADAIPVATFDGARTMVLRDGGRWLAVVGIPIDTKPGRHELVVSQGGATTRLGFDVADKQYDVQKLKVAPGQVDLSKENLERVEKERTKIRMALRTWSDRPPGTLRLQPPVPGERSSSYGLRRFFNDQARSPHTGMDIAAPCYMAPIMFRNAPWWS
jgi:murein DD-endopeptidase MepM/ murein hydrolase activator NlpD